MFESNHVIHYNHPKKFDAAILFQGIQVTQKKIIFITGTDTGVGKTLFTALLLHHFRKKPGRTLAMKPFCSGSRGDVKLLQSLQAGELSDVEMNPFYFTKPVAPFALIQSGEAKNVRLKSAVAAIKKVAKQCDQLLVEGAGGVLVPLGKRYTVTDLISKLDCQVVIVAKNQLGVINHTQLTINYLRGTGIKNKNLSVVLMDQKNKNFATRTNLRVLKELVRPVPLISLKYLGKRINSVPRVIKAHERIKSSLKHFV